jgi:hypothetical protein
MTIGISLAHIIGEPRGVVEQWRPRGGAAVLTLRSRYADRSSAKSPLTFFKIPLSLKGAALGSRRLLGTLNASCEFAALEGVMFLESASL